MANSDTIITIADTTILTADSSVVQIKKGNETILIVQSNGKKQADSIDYVGTLLIPILIVLAGGIVSYIFNKNKTKAEINKHLVDVDALNESIELSKVQRDKLKEEIELTKSEREKLTGEVEKLQIETEFLKNSFQPIVLSTIQETQKEIMKDKIAGLKELINLSKEYYSFDSIYHQGEKVIGTKDDFYQKIFSRFGENGYKIFMDFISNREYLYPLSVRNELNSVKSLMSELQESNKQKNSEKSQDLTDRDRVILPQLERYFSNAIEAIRKDLQLDSTFINDFLEKYKIS